MYTEKSIKKSVLSVGNGIIECFLFVYLYFLLLPH